jgi:hypothetical protein
MQLLTPFTDPLYGLPEDGATPTTRAFNQRVLRRP